MKWAKHVGGCLHDDQKVGKGIFFIVVLTMRISSAILGSVYLCSVLHLFTSFYWLFFGTEMSSCRALLLLFFFFFYNF